MALSSVAFLFGGVLTIALALTSPLDRPAHASFAWHMIQHLFLMMVAPALLLLAKPVPTLLWALPRAARLRVGRLLVVGAVVRVIWRAMTLMPVAWILSTVTLWLWHLPVAYELALRHRVIHDLEHLAFFWAGILFWWPIISPPPRIHGRVPYSRRVVYAVLAGGQQALLGLLLALSSEVLYPFYANVSVNAGPFARLTPLDDQHLGGVVMWAASALIGLVTLMVLIYRLLAEEERVSVSPPRPSDSTSCVQSPAEYPATLETHAPSV